MTALYLALAWIGLGVLACVANYLIRPPREGE